MSGRFTSSSYLAASLCSVLPLLLPNSISNSICGAERWAPQIALPGLSTGNSALCQTVGLRCASSPRWGFFASKEQRPCFLPALCDFA